MVRDTSWCHSGMPVTMFRGMSVVLLLLFLFSCTRAFRLGGTRTRPLQTQAAPLEMRLEDGKVLIIQNKGNYLTSYILRLFSSLSTCLPPISSLRCSYCALVYVLHIGGGHGEIGYQLCRTLKEQSPSLQITMLQDECNYKKPPFSSYEDDLVKNGIEVVVDKLTGPESGSTVSPFKDKKFDYIIDNFSKNAANATFGLKIAKDAAAKQYVFISSAGMYKGSGKVPHDENDPVKENDARKVELSIEDSNVPYTFLRPQVVAYSKRMHTRTHKLIYSLIHSYNHHHLYFSFHWNSP